MSLGLGWVCVQLLTPVIAACFHVFSNVVLCCSLFMYILIKKIKWKFNKPTDVTEIQFFQKQLSLDVKEKTNSNITTFFAFILLHSQ